MKKFLCLLVSINLFVYSVSQKPLFIAHRQNTLPVLALSLTLGVDAVEFDVQLCKTGEVVVIHPQYSDEKLGVLIAEKTVAELQQITLDGGGQIPTLEQTLDCIDKRVQAVIELKDKAHEVGAPTARIVRHYIQEKGWPHQKFILFSYCFDEVVAAKKELGDLAVAVGLVYDPKKPECSDLTLLCKTADILFMKLQNATPDVVTEIHAAGKKIIVGEADDEQTAKAQLNKGVDGVLSNNPEKAIAAFNKK